MGFPHDIASNTPAYYKFKLDDLTCNKEPVEWKEGVLQFHRDIKLAGIFTTFQISALTFIGNGAAYLKEKFDSMYTNAECTLHIYYYSFETRRYIEFPTSFKAVFASYKWVKVSDFAMGVRIEFINSGTYSKFSDREKVKLNLLKQETLSGMTFNDYYNFPLTSKIKIPALYSSYNARYLDRCLYKTDALYSLYALTPGFNSIPATKTSNDFTDTQNVGFESGRAAITDLTPIVNNATAAKTLSVSMELYINVDEGFIIPDALDIRYAIYNGVTQISDTSITTNLWGNPFGQYANPENEPRHFTSYFDVTLAEGESLYFYVYQKTTVFGHAHFIRPLLNNPDKAFGTSILLREITTNTDETIIDGLPVYEALNRACQLVLDEVYPMYSEFFGRTDSEYKASTYYSTENQLRFAHIGSGLNFRGLSIGALDTTLNISFYDLFKSLSAMYCLGMALETLTGETYERIRIEERSYFFSDVEGFNFSDRITELDIEREFITEMAYVQILTGYKSYVYRNVNGRGEYNTENTRTTVLNTDAELDLKSEVRADTIGIVNCLEKPVLLYGSEDIDEDNDIFIIKSQRDDQTTHQWTIETNENITIENDSSMFDDSSLNLYLTPSRNLIRNAELFTPALQKQLSSKIRFQSSDKMSNLETTGEGYTIKENQDIIISDLAAPKVLPIKVIFPCKMTMAEMMTLFSYRYRWHKISATESFYLLDTKMKNAEDKVTVEGIIRYTV